MIHTFKEDFYGEILSVVMVGYIRPERSYDSLGKMLVSVRPYDVIVIQGVDSQFSACHDHMRFT